MGGEEYPWKLVGGGAAEELVPEEGEDAMSAERPVVDRGRDNDDSDASSGGDDARSDAAARGDAAA